MSLATQLLCTFTAGETVDATLQQIIGHYDVAFDTIYILENVDAPTTFCCTYNIIISSPVVGIAPPATISLHRKKATNTLYTINALNLLVAELNGGRLDKGFAVPWENYRNAILVTAYDKLKRINTRLDRIIKVSDLKK